MKTLRVGNFIKDKNGQIYSLKMENGMRYALSNCFRAEHYEPEHVYVFVGKCVVTRKEYSVTVKADELFQYHQGKYIQDALVSNSADDREFLMSGISPEGWAKTFPE